VTEPLRVIIIAGPNGAGKTTFAREFLPNEADCPVFVNADLIAAGLAPFAPESAAIQAGRLMLQELARHFAARERFAFETTLSGRGYLQHIHTWQSAGYRVRLIFLQLDSAEEAIARVALRPSGWPQHSRNHHPAALSCRAGKFRTPLCAASRRLGAIRQRWPAAGAAGLE
jgi:predicted ABC-type ATPase